MSGLVCNYKQLLRNLSLVLHDPTLPSRLDPLFCCSLFYFLSLTYFIKASVLTTLMRQPLTRLSTWSSMPNLCHELAEPISSIYQLTHLKNFLLLVFMTSFINLLPHWLCFLNLCCWLLFLWPESKCLSDPGLCPEGHHTSLHKLCPAYFQMMLVMASAQQLGHRTGMTF